MTLRPLGNRVVVLRDPKPEGYRTVGGREIILPASGQQRSYFGTVEAIGPGKLSYGKDGKAQRIPMDLKVGDRVYLPEMGGQQFDNLDPRGPLVIIEEDFIKAVVE